MGTTASVAEAAALLASRTGGLHCVVNKRIERASQRRTGLDVGPEGAPEQGHATWRRQGPQPNGPPPRGTPPHGSGPGQPRSGSLTGRPPGLASARSGLLRASISTCLSRCGDPKPVALRRPTSPGTPTLCPGLDLAQPGPDGVPGLLRSTRKSSMVRAGPGTVAAARGRQKQTGLQACNPGLSACSLAAASGRGALMHDFCTISLSDRSRPGPSIERRLRACGLGRFLWWLSTTSLAGPRLGSCQGPGAAGRGRTTAIPRGAGPPTAVRQGGAGSALHRLGDSPRPVDAQPGAGGSQTAHPAAGRPDRGPLRAYPGA